MVLYGEVVVNSKVAKKSGDIGWPVEPQTWVITKVGSRKINCKIMCKSDWLSSCKTWSVPSFNCFVVCMYRKNWQKFSLSELVTFRVATSTARKFRVFWVWRIGRSRPSCDSQRVKSSSRDSRLFFKRNSRVRLLSNGRSLQMATYVRRYKQEQDWWNSSVENWH